MKGQPSKEPPLIAELEAGMVNSDELDDHVLLDVAEAAKLCRVHPKTMRAWIRKGVIPHARIGPPPGLIRIRRAALLAQLEERRGVEGNSG